MSLGTLTIAQLAERTGVNAGTLRMWESRYGFPIPSRTPSGHRRYTLDDVEKVLRVVAGREAGMSLPLAIRRVSGAEPSADRGLFARLRGVRPDLDVHVLSKPAMLALSRAIEDESCVRAERPLLYGSFQRDQYYRASERRWREISRGAAVSVVFADFAKLRRPAGAPVEVPLDSTSSALREWALVCDSHTYAVCLVGWEPPAERARRDTDRQFEALWSVEPEVVREAARICNRRAAESAPDVARRAEQRLSEMPAPAGAPELRVAASLTSRMAAYLSAG